MVKESTNYKGVPALTPSVVHDYLKEVGSKWTGQGVVVELGSWLGGSAVPLLEGLVEVGYDKPFYAFDSWKATSKQVELAKEEGVGIQLNRNLEPVFLSFVNRVYNNIKSYRGRIENTVKLYPKESIEIVLFDAPKKDPLFSICMKTLSPYFIPGVTVIGLLDYYCYQNKKGVEYMVQKEFMNQYHEHFDKIVEWPGKCDCVFFRYTKELVL